MAASVAQPTVSCHKALTNSSALDSGTAVALVAVAGCAAWHQAEWQAVTQIAGNLEQSGAVKHPLHVY